MTDSATPATPAMTALTRHRGVRRFFLLINCAAVTVVMLAASGCHKDSFNFDEFTRPTISGPPTNPDDETPGPPDLVVSTTSNLSDFIDASNTQTAGMRAGGISADFGDIRVVQYNDADGNPLAQTESLDYAHLGIGIIGDIAAANFVYADLAENVVTPPTASSTIEGAAANTMAPAVAFNGINPPTLPTATYALEGDMTYNGNRFYPDGALMADFANAEISGEISLDGTETADDFGGTTFADGTTDITNSDNLTLGLSSAADLGVISGDASGFSGALNIITAEGFFSSLSGRPAGDYSGRFNDDTDSYVGGNEARAAPQEISGIFGGITDADNNGNELKGGFLGQCSADCRLPIRLPIIGVSSTDTTAQERDGRIVLVITSDLAAPSTGLPVDINIGGNGVTANEFTFTATGPVTCTNLDCTVTIPSGRQMVELTLTPTSDFSTEGSESWTATLEDGSNYNLDAGNNNVGFDITDLIAAVGIMTSNTGIEGGAAVTLTITSSETVPATLTDGLTVTINIGDADDGEFTSANCIALVCEVVIDPTETTAILIITPSPDTAVEGGSEDWTATIAPDTDNNIFMVDSSADDAVFAVVNMLPPVVDSTTLAELNAYAMSVAVAAPPFRQGGNNNTLPASSQTLPIVEAQYNDASGNPQILTQHLQFAALGVWINGDATAVDGFQYASLADDVVVPPTPAAAAANSIGEATYDIEGDAVYKGLRLYPDGRFIADFNMGAMAGVRGTIDVRIGGNNNEHAIDDYGAATPTLADGTALTGNSVLRMRIPTATPAAIDADGFSASNFEVFFVNSNHFSPLMGDSGQIDGRFHAGTGYVGGDTATSAPPEMSGTFSIMDGTTDCDGGACELKGGFLGDLR